MILFQTFSQKSMFFCLTLTKNYGHMKGIIGRNETFVFRLKFQ